MKNPFLSLSGGKLWWSESGYVGGWVICGGVGVGGTDGGWVSDFSGELCWWYFVVWVRCEKLSMENCRKLKMNEKECCNGNAVSRLFCLESC